MWFSLTAWPEILIGTWAGLGRIQKFFNAVSGVADTGFCEEGESEECFPFPPFLFLFSVPSSLHPFPSLCFLIPPHSAVYQYFPSFPSLSLFSDLPTSSRRKAPPNPVNLGRCKLPKCGPGQSPDYNCISVVFWAQKTCLNRPVNAVTTFLICH